MRNHINIRELNDSLSKLNDCADHAPSGTYEDAKELNDLLGDTCDEFMRQLKAMGLKTPNCDQIREVECVLYGYVVDANPMRYATAEGFGSAMNTQAKDRVIRQAAESHAFLASMRS